MTTEKKVYIEAGAVDGSFQSRSDYLKDNLDYYGILIEPDPRCQDQLIRNRSNDRTTIVHAALVPLSYTDETIEMHLHNISAMNSMSSCQEERKGDYWAHGFAQTVHVPARTLQSILDENNVTVIENLFLDTEGFEEEVIHGIDHTRIKINNAEIEVHGTVWPEHLRKNINTFIPLMKEWFDLKLVDIIHEGCPKLVFSHEQPQHDSEYYVKLKY